MTDPQTPSESDERMGRFGSRNTEKGELLKRIDLFRQYVDTLEYKPFHFVTGTGELICAHVELDNTSIADADFRVEFDETYQNVYDITEVGQRSSFFSYEGYRNRGGGNRGGSGGGGGGDDGGGDDGGGGDGGGDGGNRGGLLKRNNGDKNCPNEHEIDSEDEEYVDTLTYQMEKLPASLSTCKMYKNNLLVCYRDYVIYAEGCRIRVTRNFRELVVESTEPSVVLDIHLYGANDRLDPNSINQLALVRLEDTEYLVACCDNGQVKLYHLSELCCTKRLILWNTIQCPKSVWGVDSKGEYLALSDNTHRVYLVYFDEYRRAHFASSQTLGHNVPSVSIVKILDNFIWIACVTISGEIITLKFNRAHFTLAQDAEPLEGEFGNGVIFVGFTVVPQPEEINRLGFRDDQGWTIRVVHARDFKRTYRYGALGKKIKKITKMDLKMRCDILERDAVEYETVLLRTRFYDNLFEMFSNCSADVEERLNRIKDDYLLDSFKKNKLDLAGLFYLVTGIGQAWIFNASNLVCRAETNNLCPVEVLGDNPKAELVVANRLSLSLLIPEISLYIVVSHVGLATAFRLVEYQGLRSLREEFSIMLGTPHWNPTLKSLRAEDINIVVGCDWQKVYEGVYWVYFMMQEGKVERLEITEGELKDLAVDFL